MEKPCSAGPGGKNTVWGCFFFPPNSCINRQTASSKPRFEKGENLQEGLQGAKNGEMKRKKYEKGLSYQMRYVRKAGKTTKCEKLRVARAAKWAPWGQTTG